MSSSSGNISGCASVHGMSSTAAEGLGGCPWETLPAESSNSIRDCCITSGSGCFPDMHGGDLTD